MGRDQAKGRRGGVGARHTRTLSRLMLSLLALLTVHGVALADSASSDINPRLLRRFAPLRDRLDAPGPPASDAEIHLGRMLFYEARLSLNGDTSCNSCHQLDQYGVDGKKVSTGNKGNRGSRNSPTVFNAAGHFQQFWDGRAKDVEAQASGPMMNPIEMAMPSKEKVEARLRGVPGYLKAFKAAYPDAAEPVTLENAAKAIGAFERGLTTPSRWDRYLKGDNNALTAAEKEGFKTFSNLGCMVCHTGEFLGASTFQRAGVVEPWPNQKDDGRAAVTHEPADRMVFKVPSLRNVEHTAPYFHDGSAPDLATAVRMMAKHQLGVETTDEEVASVITWLKSLTGEINKTYIARPTLPQ